MSILSSSEASSLAGATIFGLAASLCSFFNCTKFISFLLLWIIRFDTDFNPQQQ